MKEWMKSTWIRRCCPPSPGGYALRFSNHSRSALVLYAPGDPKLGMARAMEAVFGDAQPVGLAAEADRRSPTGWFGFAIRRPHDDGEGDGLPRDPVWAIPAPYGHQMPQRAVAFFALAHLLHQRGLASEVLVLPVPA